MSLIITIDLPPDVEQRLRSETADLNADARESYLVGLYRRNLLTHFQLSQALGVDRFETDGVLKKHGVMLELSDEEFAAEMADLRRIVRP